MQDYFVETKIVPREKKCELERIMFLNNAVKAN